MIFVVLGTQNKSFDRLLKAIDKEIKNKNITDEVIVQAGFTKYRSKNMKIFDYIEMNDFDEYIKKCDVLITHGGVGSILCGLKHNKKILAVPRLSKYNEHVNDHQVQIIEEFVKNEYIISVDNLKELANKLNQAKVFEPKKFKNNNKFFVKEIKKNIDKYID